jgi:hypothetical protein
MLTKVRHQLPALAALVDFWWAGVDQDLEQAAISALWKQINISKTTPQQSKARD